MLVRYLLYEKALSCSRNDYEVIYPNLNLVKRFNENEEKIFYKYRTTRFNKDIRWRVYHLLLANHQRFSQDSLTIYNIIVIPTYIF